MHGEEVIRLSVGALVVTRPAHLPSSTVEELFKTLVTILDLFNARAIHDGAQISLFDGSNDGS